MTRRTALAAVRQFFADNPDAAPTIDELAQTLNFAPKTLGNVLCKLQVEGTLRRASVWRQRRKA